MFTPVLLSYFLFLHNIIFVFILYLTVGTKIVEDQGLVNPMWNGSIVTTSWENFNIKFSLMTLKKVV